ncbi:MAG: hypothetical protein U1E17_04715 [Geminicoccaceae bacterium]
MEAAAVEAVLELEGCPGPALLDLLPRGRPRLGAEAAAEAAYTCC